MQYINITPQENGNLKITMTKNGKQEVKSMIDDEKSYDEHNGISSS
jgi:hypothetical protein